MRTPRMPRIDELPLPAQNEIRAQRGELADDHPEKRRMSLMQRLASVGLGRRADEAKRRRRRAAGAAGAAIRASAAASAAPAARRPSAPSRSRNMPAAPRRRASTRTAATRLCIIPARTTSSISRPSCAARPTDAGLTRAAPLWFPRRGRCLVMGQC